MNNKKDTQFMLRAIELARQGLGRTAPNPPVGAVIVKNGKIIGEGFHPKAGMPHAEVYAIREAGEAAQGSTLYVTLEPCNHHGKTPPCTEAIIKAGIKRVFAGMLDPNPIVAGKGIASLEQAGIKVDVGIEHEQCHDLIKWYDTWHKNNRPFCIVKAAITLDGKIAASSGDSRWISSEESRKFVHELRNHVDGIIAGIGTVLKDDPLLTCRVAGGRDPLRIVIDKNLEISAKAKCLGDNCLIITEKNPNTKPELLKTGCRFLVLTTSNETFDWKDILTQLGKMGLHSLIIEGGSGIYTSIIDSGLCDRLLLFVAPKLLGAGIPLIDRRRTESIIDATRFKVENTYLLGGDVLIDLIPTH